MKKSTKYIIIILIIIAAFLIYWNNFRKTNPNKIIATVGNEEIIYSDLVLLAQQYGDDISNYDKDKLLDEAINMKIIKIYAERNDQFSNPGIREEFTWQKDEMRKEYLIDYMLRKDSKKNISVSDSDLKEHITKHPYTKIITIFIPKDEDSTKAKKKIEKIYKQLEKGDDFISIREKYMDKQYRNQASREEIIDKETLQKLISPTQELSLGINEYSRPISQPYGYYIIKRLPDPTYEEIKTKITPELKEEKVRDYLTNYVDDLQARISINDNNLKKLVTEKTNNNSNLLIATNGRHNVQSSIIQKYIDYLITSKQLKKMSFDDIKNIARQIALQQILYEDALAKGYEDSSGFKTEWKSQEKEFEKQWENFVINKVYVNEISPIIEVSDEEIKNYYENNKDDFRENGEVKPLVEIDYIIKTKLEKKKRDDWFESIKEDYNLVIDKK